MDSIMYAMMTASSPAMRARKIGSVNRFIKNDNFCNLVQNIDVNVPKKFNYSLFAAFNNDESLRQQFNDWVLNG
jgi:hypothetical protein